MKAALADHLRTDLGACRRFLNAALALDQPDTGSLTAAGIPRWEADDYLGRLARAGELTDGGAWSETARATYRELLAPKPGPFPAGRGPREKAAAEGIASLGEDELLALLLRTGSGDEDVLSLARRLLAENDGLIGLAGSAVDELVQSQGLGPAKASEVAAAFELARRLVRAARGDRPTLTTPKAVVDAVGPDMAALRHEEFWCLPLDARSRLIGQPRTVSRGDIDGTEAGPRLFFRNALIAGAATTVAVHNHPTGDPSPSQGDLAVTRRLIKCGRLIECTLVDHIVIGDGQRHHSIRRSHPHLWGN
jgi:DNA repair protein RadC